MNKSNRIDTTIRFTEAMIQAKFSFKEYDPSPATYLPTVPSVHGSVHGDEVVHRRSLVPEQGSEIFLNSAFHPVDEPDEPYSLPEAHVTLITPVGDI